MNLNFQKKNSCDPGMKKTGNFVSHSCFYTTNHQDQQAKEAASIISVIQQSMQTATHLLPTSPNYD